MWFLSAARIVLTNADSGVEIECMVDGSDSDVRIYSPGQAIPSILADGNEDHCRKVFEEIVLDLRRNGYLVMWYGQQDVWDAQDGPPRSDEAVEIIEDDGYQD